LLLASTSPYRRELLARLRLPFEPVRPDADETPLPGEAPRATARRLAWAKARSVADRAGDAWVLGSDQVAELEGAPLGKPGDLARARAQLAAMSGREVLFHTALCLAHGDGRRLEAQDTTRVRFRPLGQAEIERYLAAEQPVDCAGSFKSDGLGIALFEAIESGDTTGLAGLPLLPTARLRREAAFSLPRTPARPYAPSAAPPAAPRCCWAGARTRCRCAACVAAARRCTCRCWPRSARTWPGRASAARTSCPRSGRCRAGCAATAPAWRPASTSTAWRRAAATAGSVARTCSG